MTRPRGTSGLLTGTLIGLLMGLLTGLASLTLCSTALAQSESAPTPVVRAELTPEQVRVGAATQLRVTVLVPTWFTQPPVFPSFEWVNAITRLPPDSSYPTSERVAGETWSGIVRDYQIYPLLGARYQLSGQQIEIQFAKPGKPPEQRSVAVPELVLTGVVPDGAEALSPYLAGTSLKLTLWTDDAQDALQAGDGIRIKARAELDGMPALFLPPLIGDLEIPGARIHAHSPAVEDGEPAVREETVTLVFQYGGEYQFPAISLQWWNTRTGSIETSRSDALSFTVQGPPPPQSSPSTALDGAAPTSNAPDLKAVLLWLLVVAALACLIAWLMRPLKPWVQQRQRRYRASEGYAFEQLLRAIKSADHQDIDRALQRWLMRLSPGSPIQDWMHDWGDTTLVDFVRSLRSERYASGACTKPAKGMASRLRQARKRYLKRQMGAQRGYLPPLNP